MKDISLTRSESKWNDIQLKINLALLATTAWGSWHFAQPLFCGLVTVFWCDFVWPCHVLCILSQTPTKAAAAEDQNFPFHVANCQFFKERENFQTGMWSMSSINLCPLWYVSNTKQSCKSVLSSTELGLPSFIVKKRLKLFWLFHSKAYVFGILLSRRKWNR